MHFPGARLFLFTSLSQASQLLNLDPLENICTFREKDPLLLRSQAILEDNRGVCGHLKKNPQADTPWTQEPYCMPKASNNETYCVYTSSNFANGRGVSFLTSSKIASTLLDKAYFTKKDLPSHVNEFSNPPYEVRNIVGRGNGLFATRKIELGEVIIAETPVGVYQSDAFPHNTAARYQYLHAAVERIPTEARKEFMAMAAHTEGDEIMGRVNTNSFFGELGGYEHFVVYPQTAYMNHDCRPNAMYFNDPNTLIQSTHASRTIQAGEEITINYISLLRPRKDRQDHLLDVWGFTCTCPCCSKSQGGVKVSDNRIQQIKYIHDALADWSENSYATTEMVEWLMELYDEEKLDSSKPMSYVFAALAYNAVGDVEKAKDFATRSLESGMINRGVEGGFGPGANTDVEDMRHLMRDAKSHWTYMSRSK